MIALTPALPRELPSPSVLVVGSSAGLAGGAAGVAVSLAGLGARVELLSACSPMVARQLVACGVVVGASAARVRQVDCVVVVDRGEDARGLVAARRGLLVVDTLDAGAWAGCAPDLVRRSPGCGCGSAELVPLADGLLLVAPGQTPYRTWSAVPCGTRADAVADCVLAALSLGLAAGLPMVTSVELAQTAADVTACLPAPLVCTTGGLVARLAGYRSLPMPEVERAISRHRRAGRRVVVTTGIGVAELDRLNQARRLGDVLVATVRTDAADRAAEVAALSCVDYVTVTDDEVPVELCPDTLISR